MPIIRVLRFGFHYSNPFTGIYPAWLFHTWGDPAEIDGTFYSKHGGIRIAGVALRYALLVEVIR